MAFDFIPPEYFDDVVTKMTEAANSGPAISKRLLGWFLLLGYTGRGKTRLAKEAVTKARSNLRIPSLVSYTAFVDTDEQLLPRGNSRDPARGQLLLALRLAQSFAKMPMSPEQFSSDSLKLLAEHYFATHPSVNDAAWFVILDEFQSAPKAHHAIIRGVRDWNQLQLLERSKRLFFVPVLVGLTTLDMDIDALQDISGQLQNHTYFVTNPLSETETDPFYTALIKSLGEPYKFLASNRQKDASLIKLTKYFGRWPVAFEYLLLHINNETKPIPEFSVNVCRHLYDKVKSAIELRYKALPYHPSQDVLQKILLYAAVGEVVNRDDPLNGKTWADSEKFGFLTLRPTTTKPAAASVPAPMDVDELKTGVGFSFFATPKTVRVEMPMLQWTMLQDKLENKLVPPELLHPFTRCNWSILERLAITSFVVHHAFYRICKGQTSAKVRQLRPGAHGTEDILNIDVPLSSLVHPHSHDIPELKTYLEADRKHWTKDSFPVILNDDVKWDLKDGGMVLGNRTQPKVEGVAVLVYKNHRILWPFQVKFSQGINDATDLPTKEETKSQSTTTIKEYAAALRTWNYKDHAFNAVICEWFTNRTVGEQAWSYKGALVTSNDCIPQVLGPILCQGLGVDVEVEDGDS